MNLRALGAEAIGTFALILIGAGAGALGVGGLVGVALAHGLTVAGIACVFGHLSGAHINPAVTAGLWVAKAIDSATALSYVAAQAIGGVLGAFLLKFLLSGIPEVSGLGATVLAEGVTPLQGFLAEAVLTFFLVNAVLLAAVDGRGGDIAGIVIGLTLTALILMGGPLTGASLNPARTLGPAIASSNYADLWLYIVGPVAGGVVAALLYVGLLRERAEPASL